MNGSSVIEAEGFADLGLWHDAWEAIEELPPGDRPARQALLVWPRCCPPLGAWEIGASIAGLLQDGGDDDRQHAAQFLHSLAVHQVSEGKPILARESIARAIACWPQCLGPNPTTLLGP